MTRLLKPALIFQTLNIRLPSFNMGILTPPIKPLVLWVISTLIGNTLTEVSNLSRRLQTLGILRGQQVRTPQLLRQSQQIMDRPKLRNFYFNSSMSLRRNLRSKGLYNELRISIFKTFKFQTNNFCPINHFFSIKLTRFYPSFFQLYVLGN